jgi:parallel beta-helix repeat protein
LAGLLALAVVLLPDAAAASSASASGTPATGAITTSSASSLSSPPSTPPVEVCGNGSLLDGPSGLPVGAVAVPPGDNSALFLEPTPANTTYWFEPGVHTLGSGVFAQIYPQGGDTFLGAPGAVIDGQNANLAAFVGSAPNVTIEYLTIENFNSPQDEGAVNHDSGDNWTIEHDTIQNTGNTQAGGVNGAAVMGGNNEVVEYNCFYRNGQYGINGYSPNNVNTMTIEYNEFNDNAPNGDAGCGCSGGLKMWISTDVLIENNYVHDNGSVGLWVDTDNNGLIIENNYISDNWDIGIMYEISYNALIEDNNLIHNGWGSGPTHAGSPTGAIYISESGGDTRVPNGFGISTLTVSNNQFTNNYGGVVLWENADRFCSDGSDGGCTLVDPSVYTIASCGANLPTATPGQSPDYFDNCRWKTQNVVVTNNEFDFDPAALGPQCTVANACGFNGLFSQYGSTVPYQAWVVPLDISNLQNNVFQNNTYRGPWNFTAFSGETVGWTQWTGGFNNGNGSGDHFNGQDTGSTYSPAAP